MSSTGQAFGVFYQICTAKSHLWRVFCIPSFLCPHVELATIEADRETLKDNVFRIKHSAEWLYDEGHSMISLEHMRDLIYNQPEHIPCRPAAFCDFAAAADESVLPRA